MFWLSPHVNADMDERIVKIVELEDLRATPSRSQTRRRERCGFFGIQEGGVNNTANE
jgi:hypothetical protein